MEKDNQITLQELSEKVDAIYRSVERTRKYFLVTMWVTVITIVVPLIMFVFAIPYFLNSFKDVLGQLQ